jgi:hypothetical protein
MGDMEQEIDPNPQQPEFSPYDNEDQDQPEGPPVQSSHSRQKSHNLRALLRKATDSEISELSDLVKAAGQRAHLNGEHKSIQKLVTKIARR